MFSVCRLRVSDGRLFAKEALPASGAPGIFSFKET
jgi:hypothetical protein